MKEKHTEINDRLISLNCLKYNHLNRITNIFNDYLIHTSCEDEIEVHMNSYSLSLYLKSIFIANPQLLYFISLINLFQTLAQNNDYNCKYNTISHSLTLYYLKILEKYGIVDILEKIQMSDDYDMRAFYEVLGNKRTKKTMKMYSITFRIKRPILKRDLVIIEHIRDMFNIPGSIIKYSEHDGTLKADVNKLVILKAFLSGHRKKQKRKTLDYNIK